MLPVMVIMMMVVKEILMMVGNNGHVMVVVVVMMIIMITITVDTTNHDTPSNIKQSKPVSFVQLTVPSFHQ